MKDISLRVAGKLPGGTFIGFVINELWPKADVDIWQAVKAQVETLVDEKILARELDERKGDLQGLKFNLEQFYGAADDEKSKWLVYVLGSCNDLRGHLTSSPNKIHLIHLTITTAFIHLAMLRERLINGERMGLQPNKYTWDKELTEMVSTYRSFLTSTRSEWKVWRRNEIQIVVHGDGPGHRPDNYVEDKRTGKKATYNNGRIPFWENRKSYQLAGNCFERVRDRMFNEIDGAFLRTYKEAFNLRRFFPGQEKMPPWAPPGDGIVDYGPYNTDTRDGHHTDLRFKYPEVEYAKRWMNPNLEGNNGVPPINGITIRAGDFMDYMEIHMLGDQSRNARAGNPNGGQEHYVELVPIPRGTYINGAGSMQDFNCYATGFGLNFNKNFEFFNKNTKYVPANAYQYSGALQSANVFTMKKGKEGNSGYCGKSPELAGMDWPWAGPVDEDFGLVDAEIVGGGWGGTTCVYQVTFKFAHFSTWRPSAGWSFITNPTSGRVLDIESPGASPKGFLDQPLIASDRRNGSPTQLWSLGENGMLLNRTGFVASVARNESGSPIVVRERYHNQDQMWDFKEGRNLICLWNGFTLDIAEGSTVHMWPKHNGDNQVWLFQDVY